MIETYSKLGQNKFLKPILNHQSLFFGVFFKLLAVGFGFYTSYWINTYLTVEDQANYNVITAYTPTVLYFLGFGINEIIQKYYTNTNSKETLQNVWATFNFLRICSYFIGLLIVVLTYRIVKIENFLLLLLLFSAQFILVADQAYLSVCNSYKRNWQFTLVDFVTKGLVAILLLIGVFLEQNSSFNLFYLASSLLISYGVGMGIDAFWQRKDTKFGKIDFKLLKENKSTILNLSISAILVAIYLSTDRLILKRFASDEVFNGYSNSYRVFEVGMIVPSLITPSLATDFKRKIDTINNNRKKTKQLVKFNILLLLFGFIVSVGFLLTSPLALMLIQRTNNFKSAYQSMPILSFGLMFLFISIFNKQILIFLHQHKKTTYSMAFTSFSALILYLVLIPNYLHYGAAVATIISFISDAVLNFYFLYQNLKKG